MPQVLAYSFDDEVASKFYYDMADKRLEIHFTRCWDKVAHCLLEGPCYLLIHQWADARCQDAGYRPDNVPPPKFFPLEDSMGIVSMILFIEWTDGQLEMVVNTIDDRYLLLLFDNPSVEAVR
jgi:hypothetical protein